MVTLTSALLVAAAIGMGLAAFIWGVRGFIKEWRSAGGNQTNDERG